MLCQLSYIHRQTIRASNRPAHGAPGGNRTPDRRIRNPLLYPTELQAQAPPLARWPARRNDPPRRTGVAPAPAITGAGRHRRGHLLAAGGMLVGARGFEPPTPCSQSRCATGLRHAPTNLGGESGRQDRVHPSAASTRWEIEGFTVAPGPGRGRSGPFARARARIHTARPVCASGGGSEPLCCALAHLMAPAVPPGPPLQGVSR